MNIAFSKIGKSIKFINENFSATGGDNEAGQMLRLLANNNPDVTFYIIGRSEFKRLTDSQKSALFDYDNIVDVWADLPAKSPRDVVTNWVIDYFNKTGVKLDASVMMVGQVGQVTIPGKIKQLKDNHLIASCIEMTLGYSTPVSAFHNENLDIPVIEICNDPRYTLSQSRDLMFVPKVSLSQYNEPYSKRVITSYEDQTLKTFDVNLTYNGMENIFLYDRPTEPVDVATRNTLFSIVLNEGNPSRYKMLNEWVLQKFTDIDVIGAWDEKYMTDPRFKGSMKLDEVHRKFSHVRCTFIIPIKTGWVTSKYIEMIHAGVVPFLHPTYDDQGHTELDSFFRPKTKEELYERVQMMQDDSVYINTINKLRNTYCTESYTDGTIVNDIVMKSVKSDYKRTSTTKVKTTNSLEGFF